MSILYLKQTVGLRLEIRDIFKLSKLYEILSRTNFGLTEMAIAFKKWNKYSEYRKSPSERLFLTRSGPQECYLKHVFMIQSSINFYPEQFSLNREGYRLRKLEQMLIRPQLVITMSILDTKQTIGLVLKSFIISPNCIKLFP